MKEKNTSDYGSKPFSEQDHLALAKEYPEELIRQRTEEQWVPLRAILEQGYQDGKTTEEMMEAMKSFQEEGYLEVDIDEYGLQWVRIDEARIALTGGIIISKEIHDATPWN